MSENLINYHKRLNSSFRGPLIAYGFLFGFYAATAKGKWDWFSWHPLSMVIGFVTLSGNAILLKKIGGYDNTKMHGNLMFLASVLAGFGWYVIYSIKEMKNKPHLTSIHGKLGAVALLGYTGLVMVGALALNPDFGIMKTNKLVRLVHKWSGRACTAVAWTACVLGVMSVQPNQAVSGIFALPLLVSGFYLLL